MVKGIMPVSLSPYDMNSYLIVVCNLNKEELLSRLSVNGTYYKNKPSSLNEIRERSDFFKKVSTLCDKYEFPSENKDYKGRFVYDTANNIYLMDFRAIDWHNTTRKDFLDFVSTVAHEVLHLCQVFLPLFLDRNTELEAEAYFHTYVMEDILDTFEKNCFY